MFAVFLYKFFRYKGERLIKRRNSAPKQLQKWRKECNRCKFPLSFSFPSYDCFSFTDVHAMYIYCHHFFHEHVEFLLRTIKGMSMGGEFSRKLSIFQNFCISSFSILCMIWFLNMWTTTCSFQKHMKKKSIECINTSICLESCGKSNLKCMLRRW